MVNRRNVQPESDRFRSNELQNEIPFDDGKIGQTGHGKTARSERRRLKEYGVVEKAEAHDRLPVAVDDNDDIVGQLDGPCAALLPEAEVTNRSIAVSSSS